MGSYVHHSSQHTSSVKDQRVGIDGTIQDIVQQGAINDSPYSVRIGGMSKTGDIMINDMEAISELASQIMGSNEKAVETIAAPIGQAIDVVESIKAPLSQYLPYAVLAVVIYLIFKFSGK